MRNEAYAHRASDCHQSLSVAGAAPRESFDYLVADSIRQIRDGSDGLTPRESQLLSDVTRRTYAAFRTVAEVADIARFRCKDPSKAAALGEAIRGYTLRDHPGLKLSWLDVLRYEGAANSMANEALYEHLLSPSRATRDRMIETHRAQEIASRAVADLMWIGR